MCLKSNNLAACVSESMGRRPPSSSSSNNIGRRPAPPELSGDAFTNCQSAAEKRQWPRPPRLFGTSSSSRAHLTFQCCTATTEIQGEVFQDVLVLPLRSSYKWHFKTKKKLAAGEQLETFWNRFLLIWEDAWDGRYDANRTKLKRAIKGKNIFQLPTREKGGESTQKKATP